MECLENITIGQIAVGLLLLLNVWDLIERFYQRIKKPADAILDKALDPLKKELASFKKETKDKLDNIDESVCKNYLVRFLKDVEMGHELDSVEIQRAYEIYAHYTNDLHRNSYIHAKWDKLMKDKF